MAIRYLAIYFGYIHGMRVNSNSANGLTRFSVPLHLKPQAKVATLAVCSIRSLLGTILDPKIIKNMLPKSSG